ncbi:hypothetical protein CPU12_02675 [Malaciobacter molluscorum LMG 25693]|uniref:PAS sensor-containing signal transduction protein n=1 Tax=Malaciobacter molluscorum LMG 25693 TaxID=870501 RepID=A0A2G1DLE8_9BACT|nr:PAS domain-containing protein [Malaciobacter molluscorum]AXX92752.1 PAS sensor-containing signal transduction protein [Malaciobacter molluscorum LMG 25693]PHO19166.1 hypothetical protein CPU12_02675 [Malaciobacter molluscorum LMG 25693]
MSQLNNLFFQIIDNFPNGFILFDENANILYTNSVFTDLLGYEKNYLLNKKKLWELDYHINSPELFKQKITNLMRIKKSNRFSIYIKNDGTLYRCQKQNFSFMNNENETNYFFSIIDNKNDTILEQNYFYSQKLLNEKIDTLRIPLFTIFSSISAFKLKNELNLPLTEQEINLNIDAIEKSANQLNNLIKTLKP